MPAKQVSRNITTIWIQPDSCARLESVVADIVAQAGVDSAADEAARTVQAVAMVVVPTRSGAQDVVATVPTWKLA